MVGTIRGHFLVMCPPPPTDMLAPHLLTHMSRILLQESTLHTWGVPWSAWCGDRRHGWRLPVSCLGNYMPKTEDRLAGWEALFDVIPPGLQLLDGAIQWPLAHIGED